MMLKTIVRLGPGTESLFAHWRITAVRLEFLAFMSQMQVQGAYAINSQTLAMANSSPGEYQFLPSTLQDAGCRLGIFSGEGGRGTLKQAGITPYRQEETKWPSHPVSLCRHFREQWQRIRGQGGSNYSGRTGAVTTARVS
jgi:hypothetical protein